MRQPTPAAHVDNSVSEIVRRNSRKRKSESGTVVDGSGRRSSRKYMHSARASNEHAIEEEHGAMYSEQSIPSSEVRRRRSLYPMRNQRYQRLSAAREDLDEALQAAIGGTSVTASSSDVDRDEYLASDDVGAGVGGELTSANEDFTMITGESLASISFRASGRAVGDATHLDDEMEDAHGEHLTSSPPQKAMYPDLTEQAEEAKTPMLDGNQDAMDWRYNQHETSQQHDSPRAKMSQAMDGTLEDEEDVMDSTEVVIEDDEVPVDEHSSPVPEPPVYHHSPTPQPGASESPHEQETITGAPNPADEEADAADDDIWAEEASRDIDESAITTTTTTSRAQRSIRSRAPNEGVVNTTNDVPPIFSEQPDPPRRAKLPRTWRQTSGVDFSYADSPERTESVNEVSTHRVSNSQHQPEAPTAQRASGDEAESGRSSGVLTPPTTDDDDSGRKLADRNVRDQGTTKDQAIEIEEEDEEEEEEEEEEKEGEVEEDEAQSNKDEEHDISGFTNPGAADTQLEAHHRFGRQHSSLEQDDDDDDVVNTRSESGSGEETPGESGEDTGFFWQNNMPQVYRSGKEKPKLQTRKEVDLSAILRMDSSKVEDEEPAKSHLPQATNAPRSYSRQAPNKMSFTVHRKPAMVAARPNRPDISPNAAKGNILPSPLRRSLLRTSKALDSGDAVPRKTTRDAIPEEPESRIEETQLTATDDSLASKAGDERQLLEEIRATTPVAKRPAHERLAVLRDGSQTSRSNVESGDASYDETETTFRNSWPEQSYEENLNIESPQKIGVNFNDSTLSFQQQQHSQARANPLAPRVPVKPLFEKSANAPIPKPSYSIPAPPKQRLSPSSPSINPVSYKPQVPHQENEGVLDRLSTTFWSAITRSQGGPPPTPAPAARTTEQTISLSLRAQLRSRYGVLPNAHPWTMLHMRTLHRMLNSVESGRRDSIVPTHAPLPPHLRDIIDEGRLSATGRAFRFEKPHACVVQAFMQLLVAPSLFKSMEKGDVEWLGDAQAEHLRGEMGGRLGSELCFKTLKPGRGLIGWEWVVECLGCCVVSNVEMGMRRVEVERVGTVRDVEMSVMGDGEGDGRVREWFEREDRRELV
jgi:hypothetical protein